MGTLRSFRVWLLLLVGLLVGGVAMLLTAAVRPVRAESSTPVRWGTSVLVQDSLILVPARWAPACDALGCADSYRVTWAASGLGLVGALSASADDVAESDGLSRVLRDTTITEPLDAVTVPVPEIGQPITVCLYVVAMRRGLASDVTSACRTVERPDRAPPAVDSIVWDSLGITPPGLALDSASFRLQFSQYSVGINADSSALDSALVRDTVLVVGDIEREGVAVTANHVVRVCGTVLDTEGNPVIIVPNAPGFTVEQVARYIRDCRTTPRAREAADRVKLLRDVLTFSVLDTAATAAAARSRSGT